MLEPGEILGSFEILETLGSGAMGQVYRARGPEGEVVAVKLIAQELAGDVSACQRFASENAILKDLRQPRIVAARTGLEREGQRLYYAMEWVEGTDLSALLEAEGALSEERALGAVADVLEALGYAHARDVLHRDVKASNVLIDPSGRMKLGDFGLARALDGTRVTRAGSVLGTPAYMAPELAEGGEASVATEIYAVGVLLHELLAGAPPFGGQSALAVLHQHLHAPPPPLEGVRVEVQGIVARALAKRPSERYASATEMRDAVLLARGSLPGGSPPPPVAGAAHLELAAAETREIGVPVPPPRSASQEDDPESARAATLASGGSGEDPQGPAAFRTTVHAGREELAAEGPRGPSSAPPEARANSAPPWPLLLLALAALVLVGLGIRSVQGPPESPPRPSAGLGSPRPTASASQPGPSQPAPSQPAPSQPAPSQPAPSGSPGAPVTAPAPSPRVLATPTPSPRPRVEVRLRDGTTFQADLERIDLERDELVTREGGQIRRDALGQVESYQRVE